VLPEGPAAPPLVVPRLVEPQVVESQVALAVPEQASLAERRLAVLAFLPLEELQLAAQRLAGLAAGQLGPVQQAA